LAQRFPRLHSLEQPFHFNRHCRNQSHRHDHTAKSLIAGALAFAFVGGVGTYVVVQHSRAARAPVVAVAAAAANPGEANLASADAVSGILKTPDGKPLPNAQVFLSTASAAVAVYSAPSPEVLATTTTRDGRFSFPASPENRAVIVVSDEGYGQATVAELASRTELTSQPWARVEGTLRKGTTALANQTIHLSRTRFGSKDSGAGLSHRSRHEDQD